jgi:tetratricopeptide (TPR) repeat protein
MSALAALSPHQSAELLQRAVTLNPYDAQSWIHLGLDAEINRRSPALAERHYLRAAAIDRMYLPRWTLANFYFRQQNRDKLFEWAHRALTVTPYDATPLFAALWFMSPDQDRIAAAMPDRDQVLLQYASFLSQTNRLQLVNPVLDRAISLSPSGVPLSETHPDVPLPSPAAAILDRFLQAGSVEPALHLWRRLTAARWLPPYATPSPARPLTNGSFQLPLLEYGFDWRVPPVAGVTFDQFPDLGQIRFTFSGTQPEACPLLEQYLPLQPGRRYRLVWTAAMDRIAPANGLTWRIDSFQNGSALLISTGLTSPDVTSGHDAEASWEFQAPDSSVSGTEPRTQASGEHLDPKPRLFLITLEYSRPIGKIRIEGALSLRNVSLTAL